MPLTMPPVHSHAAGHTTRFPTLFGTRFAPWNTIASFIGYGIFQLEIGPEGWLVGDPRKCLGIPGNVWLCHWKGTLKS
eukprot:1140142-Pelagomonas_calceolata.AAC.6